MHPKSNNAKCIDCRPTIILLYIQPVQGQQQVLVPDGGVDDTTKRFSQVSADRLLQDTYVCQAELRPPRSGA